VFRYQELGWPALLARYFCAAVKAACSIGWAMSLGDIASNSVRVSATWMQGLTLVPISAQIELTLHLSAQIQLTLSTLQPKLTCGRVPQVLKLSYDVSAVFPKVLKLSSEVSELKPLPGSQTSPPSWSTYPGTSPWRAPSPRHFRPAPPRTRGLHSFPFQLNLSASVYRITQINS